MKQMSLYQIKIAVEELLRKTDGGSEQEWDAIDELPYRYGSLTTPFGEFIILPPIKSE